MGFALELALDEETSTAVCRLWRTLAEAGFGDMAALGARPHISLGVWEAVGRDAFERELVGLAERTGPLAVTLERVTAFTTTGVVYLATAPAPALAAVQARAQEGCASAARRPSPYYAPDVWVPHCTLAQDLSASDLAAALAIARGAPLPLRGRLERAALVEFRPVRTLAEARLTGPARH